MMTYTLDRMIPVSELMNKFKKTREKVQEKGYLTVFNMNKPDVVISDIHYFEQLLEMAEQFEQLEMYVTVQKAKERNELIPFNPADYD